MYDVIIIGAGASGFMAAIHAAERGRNVLVVDHADRGGKKMLISGGGKCNITNHRVTATDYFGSDITFTKFAIKHFPPASVFDLLRKAHIETEEREYGRIFCKKGANEIVSYLINRAENTGVSFFFNTKVLEVIHYSRSFCIKCKNFGNNESLESPHLLIATGGLACPQIGATNLGYTFAKQFGHTITSLKPALTGFILPPDSTLLHLQGISLDVQLKIEGKNKVIEEPLLFTHQGVSGPAVLQASCFWEERNVVIINFLPSNDIISLMHKPENGRLTVKTLITQFLPVRLVNSLLTELDSGFIKRSFLPSSGNLYPESLSDRRVAELSKNDRKIIAGCIHQFRVIPDAVEGFQKAEATLGGISTHEINPESMESLIIKGLFFSGEVIDITGKLGGYNIHWAFASGYIAGQNL